ncbi:MAG: glycosyltransferase family 25 protein [Burkholderiaceae bacterium]
MPDPRTTIQPGSLLIQVINLDRSPDRLKRIGGRLDELGLVWERMPALDGNQLDLHDPALIDRAEFARRHGKLPLPGELGCYLSHVRAVRRVMSSNARFGLILEDDAVLGDSLPGVLAGLMHSDSDWDVVKFSGVHRGHPKRLRALDAHHDLVVMLTKCTASSGYMINRQAALVLGEGLLPMRIPFDHEFDRGWHWNLRVRYVRPYPIRHDQVVLSTINDEEHGRGTKFHWSRRLPAFGWRARNEWSRLSYGLKAWLASGRS